MRHGQEQGAPLVVWILGARFSRSLGAPLLTQMLTPEGRERAHVAFPELTKNLGRVLQDVVTLCEAGTYDTPDAKPKGRHWTHAEEFLERLDLAIADPKAAELLGRFKDKVFHPEPYPDAQWPAKYREAAIRLMAAECCAFLENADPDSERWEPYFRWAKLLSPADAVVTFNYDRVPDLLAEKTGTLQVPAAPIDVTDTTRKGSGTAVWKLHGSVDWVRSAAQSKIVRAQTLNEFAETYKTAAIHCRLDELALATPGPTKKRMVSNEKELQWVWHGAESAIMRADAIVFVGYRMPPTDAYTRTWLLECIRTNHRRSEHRKPLPIYTVLGANVNSVDSLRLQGILGMIERVVVRPQPMFAEDFLAVFDRAALLQDFIL
jgi:hypothetical protein